MNIQIDVPSQQPHQKDNQTINIPDLNQKKKGDRSVFGVGPKKKKEKDFLSLSQQVSDPKQSLVSFLHQNSLEEDNPIIVNKKARKDGSCKCQMLRSSSLWSMGLKSYEDSIHIAYLGLITNAQHFIYIENQFFISSLAGRPVKNAIAEALVNRIRKAAANGENFRVIIVMPLLPVIFKINSLNN